MQKQEQEQRLKKQQQRKKTNKIKYLQRGWTVYLQPQTLSKGAKGENNLIIFQSIQFMKPSKLINLKEGAMPVLKANIYLEYV